MEIKTGSGKKEPGRHDIAVPPDTGRYLRRKGPQKLRKSRSAGGKFVRILRNTLLLGIPLALLAAAFAAVRFAHTSEFFSVQNISVEGNRRLREAAIEGVIRREFPANILRIDLQKLQERIEAEAWVRRVELRRVLPSGMVVYVQERIPSVIAEIQGEMYITDNEGILLDGYSQSYQGLDVPVFRGLLGHNPEEYALRQEENSARIGLGLRVLSDLAEGAAGLTHRISELDLSDAANVRLMMVDDTSEIMLGDRDFLARFQTFVSNLPEYRELKSVHPDIAAVDLRFDGKIIYRQRPGAAQAAETLP